MRPAREIETGDEASRASVAAPRDPNIAGICKGDLRRADSRVAQQQRLRGSNRRRSRNGEKRKKAAVLSLIYAS
jgi:hypothetical protein